MTPRASPMSERTMKSARTIRDELSELRRRQAGLHSVDRATDQAYGAIEALRWVLNQGPRPAHLATTLLSNLLRESP